MMKKVHFIVLVVLCALACMSAQAQTMTTLPYFQGFETTDAAENALWVLNPGSTGTAADSRDKWMIGPGVRAAGKQSLYISRNGSEPRMGDQPVIQYAYREYVLKQGAYTLTFDWLCEGNANAELLVGTTASPLSASTSAAALPMGVSAKLSGLRNSITWQSASIDITSFGVPIRVFFAWRNNNTIAADTLKFAACIDNIQLTNKNAHKPTNLEVTLETCDSVTVSWKGDADEYELEYRSSTENAWYSADEVDRSYTGGSTLLNNLQDGAYDFRVRGVYYDLDGTPSYSAYEQLTNYPIFCPDQHCINFVNLTDPELVTCTYGTTSYSGGYSGSGNSAYSNVGVVDFGWESINSRHTVNWDRTATDPRTGGQLKLVPTGEFASVRLGNWDTGYGAESVAYDYVVDSVNSILLIKYACVMEDPSHDGNEQPRLKLEILDANGNPVRNDDCGQLNFFAGQAGDIWNDYNPTGSTYSGVKWKDWTQLGLNLNQYVGQHVKIRFTTYDCFQGGHYGYAYFTLGCAESTIKVNSCGAGTNMEAQAPAGFDYKWFRGDDPTETTLSTNQKFYPSDSAEYVCRMTYKNLARCYFELRTMINPRTPIASFSYEYSPENCKNRVYFHNESFVRVRLNGQWVDRQNERPTEYEWHFPTRTDSKQHPYYDFPKTGGTFDITLSASMASGACSHDTVVSITVPAIGDWLDTTRVRLCSGEHMEFGGVERYETGVYSIEGKTFAGCDSIAVLDLTVLPNLDKILADTTLCYGEEYVRGEDVYPYAGSHMWMVDKVSEDGCPYIIVQQVYVTDEIVPQITVQQIDATHDQASITLGGTGYTSYLVNGKPGQGSVVAIEEEVSSYHLEFVNEHGCVVDTMIDLCPYLIYQRWDDVLSLRNQANGGYDYDETSYQWCKNGQPIEGANLSYYYEENGGLDMKAIYTVRFRVKGDPEERETCPYSPKPFDAPVYNVSPSLVRAGAYVNIKVSADAVMQCYSSMGTKMIEKQIVAGDTKVQMPMNAGMYLITLETAEGRKTFRVSVTD